MSCDHKNVPVCNRSRIHLEVERAGKKMLYEIKWWVEFSSEILQLNALVEDTGEPALNSYVIFVTDDEELRQMRSDTVDVSHAPQ